MYKYRMKFLVFLLLLALPFKIFSQNSSWLEVRKVSVDQNGKKLLNPFAGSFNAAQVESMDLNGDGIEDLLIFDRTCQKLSTYIVQVNANAISYLYAPEWEKNFPFVENWIHLVDFDQDQRKDLFTYSSAGIKVYRNTGNGKLNQFLLFQDPIYSEGFSGMINLYVAPSDIPAIGDLDSDGDVDILAFEPAGHFLELHQNFSVDQANKPGLHFKRTVQGWGNFVHNDCYEIVFNSPFNQLVQTHSEKKEEQVLHVGNSLSLWDPLKTGKKDLLFGHISCSNLVQLSNRVSGLKPSFSSPLYDFPSSQPIQVIAFAHASPIDINKDGIMDLLVSTNTTDNVNFTQDFQKNLRFYQQTGLNLEKQSDDFLQSEMIDVGENASPVFWDADQDGDLDLLIGNAGIRGEKGVRASIYWYENKGTDQSPTYVFQSKDFLKLAEKNQCTDLHLQIVDWNLDGKKDLVITYETFVNPQMQVLIAGKQTFLWYDLKNILPGELPYFKDIDQDGQLDALVLSKTGQIQRFQIKETLAGVLEWQLVEPDCFSLSKISKWSTQSLDVLDDLGDGQLKFVAMDKLGNLHWGEMDFKNNRVVENAVPSELAFNFGRKASVQSVDWNQDGKMDLLIGLGGGGLRLMQNTSRTNILDNQEALFQLWPNPSTGEFYVRANKKGQLLVMDLLGRMVRSSIQLEEKETKKENLNGLAKGMYFVQFIGESGGEEVKRLIVE